MMPWCCIVYAGVKSLDDVAFRCSLMLQWGSDVLMQIESVVAAKQKKTFILRDILLEEFTIFKLLCSSSLRKYLPAQILVKVLRKKESYKPLCQAKAMHKFDCYRSWPWLCPPSWFSSVISFSVLRKVTLEKRPTGLAGIDCLILSSLQLLNFFYLVGIIIFDFLISCWQSDLLICTVTLFEAPCLQLVAFLSGFLFLYPLRINF